MHLFNMEKYDIGLFQITLLCLEGSTISAIKSKIIDISKQLDQMFKYIEKKISINDITTQRLLALNLMDKNIVSILMDRLLFWSQIFRYVSFILLLVH